MKIVTHDEVEVPAQIEDEIKSIATRFQAIMNLTDGPYPYEDLAKKELVKLDHLLEEIRNAATRLVIKRRK